jgi:hypothetical protein
MLTLRDGAGIYEEGRTAKIEKPAASVNVNCAMTQLAY